MNYLLDGIHEDLNKVPSPKPYVEEKEANGRADEEVANERWEGFLKRNDSFIVDKFFGLCRSEVRCDAKECTRVSVTFNPQRAVMLPLPAVRTVMIKITMVYADPNKPVTRYGVTVNKSGKAKDIQNWLSEKTMVDTEHIILTRVNYCKVQNCIKLTENVKSIHDISYCDYYAYEILTEKDIQEGEGEKKNQNEEEESQEQKEEPEKDENGYYIGQKCRCRWKSMNGAYYNCEIRERNETAPTLTYAIDYADGDKDDSVDLERLTLDEWEKDPNDNTRNVMNYGGPDAIGAGFHTDIENGRITVEALHRVAKTTYNYGNTPQKTFTQWPLILSMKKNIKCDELHNLVWKHVNRFVTPDSEWNRHNLPYCLRIGTQYNSERTTKEPILDIKDELVNLEEKQKIVIDWSAEGVQTGFDKILFERREDDESMPSRANKEKVGLSLQRCFTEMAKEEQLGENDKWHCSQCRKEGREPFRCAYKKMTVFKTGEILVLHLKRFVFEAGFSASFVHREKIDSTICKNKQDESGGSRQKKKQSRR